jgi:hypothetical protein
MLAQGLPPIPLITSFLVTRATGVDLIFIDRIEQLPQRLVS